MKKFITLAVLSVFTLVSNAQYRGSYNGGYRPAAPSTSRYRDPGHYMDAGHYWGNGWNRPYFGLRIGASFSNIGGEYFSGGEAKTGVNVGMALGIPMSGSLPLYFETGLYYNEKGERLATNSTGYRYKCNLDYLEFPFVFKYIHHVNEHFSVQPYFGGYAAIGVAGKTRLIDNSTTNTSTARNSFGDDGQFPLRRGDAGIKLGCGVGYDLFYADITYDWGLADISRESALDAHNGAFMINVGINF